jgi:integrase
MAIPIRKATSESAPTKLVEANQKAIDALPLNSGTWKVKGIPGLYVRARVTSKSFMLQRRIDGDLVRLTLKASTMKTAKEEALRQWGGMEPNAPPEDAALTLGTAIEQYIEAKSAAGKMAPKTAALARYNFDHYLVYWKNRTLRDVGTNKLAIRQLQQRITSDHGQAASNQVVRLLAAVYRWCRDADDSLPEWSRKAAEIHNIKPRDWAYSPDDLRAWWHAIEEKKKGERRELGVKTLGTIKRIWWLTALFTGARKGSIESLKWADVDLDKKVIRFRVTKGDRPYSIPMSDALAELLTRYQASGDVPPSEWVFPSPAIDGAHLIDVKNPNEGVGPAHRLRHTFRTTLAELGAAPDQARMLMGHSLGGDVSRNYITSSLVTESLRPIANAVAEHYVKIIPGIVE